MRVYSSVFLCAAAGAAMLGLAACSTTSTASATSGGGWNGKPPAGAPQGNHPLAQETLARMVAKDPGIKRFLKDAYGYVVFPTVSQGAFIVGGSYGEGGAFQGGEMVARCSIAKGSVGFQIGGQAYSEVIFFKTRPYFDTFLAGDFTFNTGVSAVAVTAGATANVSYNEGVAVFTLPKGGLIASAAVGGQNFDCHPTQAGAK